MEDPHVSTEMHRQCSLVVQVVHILRAFPPAQTSPLLNEFDIQQRRWTNRLLPDIPELAAYALMHASLDRVDGGFGLVPASVITVPAFVGSKVDATHAVTLLPGQRSVANMTALLPELLTGLFEEHDMTP